MEIFFKADDIVEGINLLIKVRGLRWDGTGGAHFRKYDETETGFHIGVVVDGLHTDGKKYVLVAAEKLGEAEAALARVRELEEQLRGRAADGPSEIMSELARGGESDGD